MQPRSYTATEALTVHGRLTRLSGQETADRWLEAKGFTGVAETIRAAEKKRRKRGRAAEAARIDAMVTERLAARRIVPAGTRTPITESAPAPARPLHEMTASELSAHASEAFGAYGRAAGLGSPLWNDGPRSAVAESLTVPAAPQPPPVTSAAGQAGPEKPLHQMDADSFQAHAADVFAAAEPEGFRSPFWRG